MNFLELAKKRFSVRHYEAKKVEEDKLLQILEAGRVAPTAANHQPQRIIVASVTTCRVVNLKQYWIGIDKRSGSIMLACLFKLVVRSQRKPQFKNFLLIVKRQTVSIKPSSRSVMHTQEALSLKATIWLL